jgi:hypothetical protein
MISRNRYANERTAWRAASLSFLTVQVRRDVKLGLIPLPVGGWWEEQRPGQFERSCRMFPGHSVEMAKRLSRSSGRVP